MELHDGDSARLLMMMLAAPLLLVLPCRDHDAAALIGIFLRQPVVVFRQPRGAMRMYTLTLMALFLSLLTCCGSFLDGEQYLQMMLADATMLRQLVMVFPAVAKRCYAYVDASTLASFICAANFYM